MIKLLKVSHKQLYFTRKENKYSSIGGFSVWHNNLLRYFDELHLLASICEVKATQRGCSYLDKRIRIHKPAKHYSFINFGLIKNIFLTAQICIKHDIDIVIGAIPTYDGLMGIFGAFLARKKRILEFCGDWFVVTDLRRPAFGFITKILTKLFLVSACQLSDYIIVRSHAIKKSLIKFGIKPNKIGIVPGTTVDFLLLSIPQLSARKEAKTVIFIGRLSPEKGLFDLIESMNLLWDGYKIKKVKLKIVGDGPLRKHLEHKVNAMKLDDMVEFAGYIPHEEISKHIADAWVLVLPSLTEGFPKVLLEAMAAGRPFVATKVGGVPDIVENGVEGILVEPNNPRALAQSIFKILTDERLAIKMGKAGRRKAKKYSIENVQNQYSTIIRKV